ncbi:MAG: DUF6065 family protein [Alphaproteobacteria bacterium]|nr:DUF6065 family protein [Alphaproteobacteria bacterium]
MSLIAYPVGAVLPEIQPAKAAREWMDRTTQQFAYRCLPLNIANAYGWNLINPMGFFATWSGETGVDAIGIQTDGGEPHPLASSHFGSGVLTFGVGYLFRTEPGYGLLASGPLNVQKDALQPLAGIIETDWSPYTFTMNWKFTRTGRPVRFEAGEPFCQIYPVQTHLIDDMMPEIRDPAEDNPELYKRYREWSQSRTQFNKDLKVDGTEAKKQGWQREYFQGKADKDVKIPHHKTKVRPRPFADKRKQSEDAD